MFEGDLSTIYRANLLLRTGNRVLLRIGDFLAQNYPMLYNRAYRIDWVALLGNCPDVEVHVSSRESRLRHAKHISDVVLAAIADRVSCNTLASDSDPSRRLTVHVRLYQDRCTVSLDTSGEPLYRRGYRVKTATAPIRPTTAAALLMMASSTNYDLVLDPFCGTGTFVIEAESIAAGRPPGLNREFAIANSPLHAERTYAYVRRAVQHGSKRLGTQVILGSDLSPDAISAARANAAEVGISCDVGLTVSDALGLNYSQIGLAHKKKLVVANLPYGKRLGSPERARKLAEDFVAVIKTQAVGWDFVVVTPSGMELDFSGLTVTQNISFSNGGILTRATFGSARG